MDNSKASSKLNRIENRLRHIEQSIEARVGNPIENVFELMVAREILGELSKIFDDDSVCLESIDKIDQLMEQLEMMQTTNDLTTELQ